MKGLLIKDFCTMKSYLKTLVVLLAFFSFSSFFIRDKGAALMGFIGAPCMMVSVMMGISSMTYDKMANWDRYALTMPISRKTIVMEKYILTVVMLFLGIIASLLLTTLVGLVYGSFDPAASFGTVWGFLGVGLLMSGLCLPMTFKFGAEKSRIVMIACCLIPFLLVAPLLGAVKTDQIQALVVGVVTLFPVFGILVFFVSYFFSVHIYQKKEF